MKGGGGMKKDEARYTLRFNPKHPRHKRTMEFLDSVGRHKASYLADIVCEHLDRHHYGSSYAVPLSDARQGMMLEQTSDELDYAKKEAVSPSVPISASKNSELSLLNEADIDSSQDTPIGDDVRQAILGGLSMFNG
jgi:hypothetical protein